MKYGFTPMPNMMKSILATLALALVFSPLFAAQPSRSFPARDLSSAELQLALNKLAVVGNVLYVAAHPDDENTSLLSYMSNEKLLGTAYLSITRGDGGQNLIGSEKGELLGVLRTQELLAARRIDNSDQFFTRAIDFGYTKSPVETFDFWGKEATLGDVVWVIRYFQPDVIITRFPTSGAGGHGQHTASAILATEAFKAAGDRTRFPEQLKFVQPWQPKRLFFNTFRPQLENRTPDMPRLLTIDLGTYNELLGQSYTEIAAGSRSMHKSQGFGAAERRGSIPNYFELLDGDPVQADLFEGLNLTWSRIPNGNEIGRLLEKAAREFRPAQRDASVPVLLDALRRMDGLVVSSSIDGNSRRFVEAKRADLLSAIQAAAGLWVEAIASTPAATAGSNVPVKTTVINRSNQPMRLAAIRSLGIDLNKDGDGALESNKPLVTDLTLSLPASTPITQPYWLQGRPSRGAFDLPDARVLELPENRAALSVAFTIEADGVVFPLETPVVYRWTDRVRGEQHRPFDIVPAATVNFDQRSYFFPDSKPREVRARTKTNLANVKGTLRLEVPAGWKVSPPSAAIESLQPEETTFRFTVTPGPAANGRIRAILTLGDQVIDTRSEVAIDYPHVPQQRLFPAAEASLVRADLKRKGTRIGYIMGPGDEIPEALRQVGYDVALLTDEDLDTANLAGFDAIVAGVRAYNTRARLRPAQKRLLNYVAGGGTLIVQYNTPDDLLVENLGPYPFKISRDRVTMEDAPVSFVNAQHPLLLGPNAITPRDFEGWVQERGLYFAGEWDPRYEAILVSNDPGEKEMKGGLLFARHGKGVFIYTGYAFFRQLPAGVPGAYRLFATLVSAGKK